jgi:hypothetical protein
MMTEISGVGDVMTWNAYDGKWEMATRIQYLNVISCKALNMLASSDVTMLLLAFSGRTSEKIILHLDGSNGIR